MKLGAEIREGVGISWSAIRANPMRSTLTTLGIVIGIVTVSLMATYLPSLDTAIPSDASRPNFFWVSSFPVAMSSIRKTPSRPPRENCRGWPGSRNRTPS